jgi:protein-histidine pros-kinase
MLMMGVPAYAAKKVMEAVKKTYPEYSYRELALNPTNPDHLPVDWEERVINSFRADESKTREWGVRQTAQGPMLYLAHPIQIKQSGCLGCHTTPQKAPPQLVAKYGSENGYGWKLKEIVGAQFVMVPMAVPIANANRMFITFMTTLSGVFIVLFILLNLMLTSLVTKRLGEMAVAADEISKGNFEVGEFNDQGEDEVAQLSAAFNRMRRSLVKAMDMFNRPGGL